MVAATEECLGTTSSAFVEASLYQVVAAARLPNSGISEVAVNATLAFIEGAKPQGEVECALNGLHPWRSNVRPWQARAHLATRHAVPAAGGQ